MFATFWESLTIFLLKSQFLNFCESFTPDFKNLPYLLHWNESEDYVHGEKGLKKCLLVQLQYGT